jgi:hypothetical protein
MVACGHRGEVVSFFWVFVMFRNKLVVSLTLMVILGCVNDAAADLITPSGLNPGDHFRVVFVTNSVTAATSGDISTYDQIAATDAHNTGLDTYNGSAVTWGGDSEYVNN